MSDGSERLDFLRWKIERLIESRPTWTPAQRDEYHALTHEEAEFLGLQRTSIA